MTTTTLTTPHRTRTPPSRRGGARCAAPDVDPDWWHPRRGDWAAAKLAKTLCGLCQLQPACLRYAMQHRLQHGIYGGLTGRERQKLRRSTATSEKAGSDA